MTSIFWSILDFFFPRQLARLSYLIRFCLIATAMFMVFMRENTGPDSAPGFFHALLVIYWIGFCIIPRAKDCGVSYWALLVLLVPVINIFPALVLFFKRSGIDPAKAKELMEPE